MSRSTKRNLILSCVLFLLSFGGSAFMLWQVHQQGIELSKQVSTLQAEQAREQAHIQLQRTADETRDDRAQLRQYFLAQESDSIDFLNLVEQSAPQVGVALSTNSLNAVTGANDATWIETSFTFQGERAAVDRFITLLETVPYVSQVMSLQVQARTSTEWQANVVMRIRVLNYDE